MSNIMNRTNTIDNVSFENVEEIKFSKNHRLDEILTLSRPTDNIPKSTKILVYGENDELTPPHFHVSIDNGKVELEILLEHVEELIIWRAKGNRPKTWDGYVNVKMRITEWLHETNKHAFNLTNLQRLVNAWNDANPTNEIEEDFCH